jgi:uncharacterized OB-fold protein
MRVVEATSDEGSFARGRPLPGPDQLSGPFWRAAAEGRLLVQECAACCQLQFYPRTLCLACGGPVGWLEASGRGTVYTFTVIRQNLASPFDRLGPYAVAMIELDEGPRMMGSVVGVDPGDLRIGLAVNAFAVRMEADLGLVFWEPAMPEV